MIPLRLLLQRSWPRRFRLRHLVPLPPSKPRWEPCTEEDIARIVEKVAGAVIERLAPSLLEKVIWEVVPDLTEAMIRDEIRTIKEGIR